MQKPGGIIALIGNFRHACGFTLIAGGFGRFRGASASLNDTAVDTTASTAIAGFGVMGLICSFATIVLGAIAMGAKSRKPGILLILCAIGGAITGGTFVAVCMVLTLVGGILATLGVKPAAEAEADPGA